MIGEQQQIRLAVFFKRRARAAGKRLNVQLVIGVVADKGDARYTAAGRQNACQFVPDGSHRGARILRIKGQHHNVFNALRQQRVDGAFQGWLTVAHTERNGHVRQTGGQRLLLTTAVDHQRRAFFHPHGLIELCYTRRTNRQNDTTQQWPPQQSWGIHDARVA